MQKLESRNLQLYYGDFHALKGISMGMKKEHGYCVDWPLRMWKIDIPPVV
jgi:hypothetical protein